MRLVAFRRADGEHRLGVLGPEAQPSSLIDLTAVDPQFATAMIPVLEEGPAALARIRDVVAQAPASARVPLERVTLLPPIANPSKIIAVGLNYRDHAEETGDSIPQTPVVFAKFPSSVAGPFADIVYPANSSRVDYEGELGVVIGTRCRDISVADAPGVIAGYVTMNDVSARDVQNATSQWTLGKSFDTFAPFGPALVTADEIADPQDLDIEVYVNDELRQKSNTRNMIFPVNDLVSRLSAVVTLQPGDIIATGTPGGVGIGFTPERLLSVGDVVTVDIARVGTIRNRVVASGGTR
jgi:2-keto-4-pentenoate hydratase/2-oxohepta-3-ene-1,7-dioic acid hydratase in catechol pathway